MATSNLIDSLSYKPVELGFGTSGLRGLVIEMTDLECYVNTLGFVQFLREHDNMQNNCEVILAGDLRKSTPRIMKAVYAAITDSGLVATNCGLVPTPTAALLGYERKRACIVVTGSHIPADRNGIKYYKTEGEILKSDEDDIKACVAQTREKIYRESATQSKFDSSGSLKVSIELPAVIKEAEGLYKQRFLDFFMPGCLNGKKIVFYQHSAVGRDLLVDLLHDLGAEVIPVERSEEFVPIDTENVTQKETRLFKKFADEHSNIFAIVSTDGDSDRPFVIDETGVFHRGDVLGCIVADFLNAKHVVAPISSNDALDRFAAKRGMTIKHTKIGSPYVIEAMDTYSSDDPTVGWEVNGGFLVGNRIKKNGRILTPLPTRDAALPIICALLSAINQGLKLSQLFSRLPQRYTGSGLIDNIPAGKIEDFKSICKNATQTRKLMQAALGNADLGNVQTVDLTDGLRVLFESNDVIHLRPSGNAPQFRVYTNTDSQKRADKLVNDAIKPGGYIETLLDSLRGIL